VRFGILRPEDLPQEEVSLLGETGARRIDTLVHDLVEKSEAAGDIVQSEEIGDAMLALRRFMFDHVYLAPHARGEHARARQTVRQIVDHLAEGGSDVEAIVTFVSGMTDRFALEYAERLK
jgi:dGTPase